MTLVVKQKDAAPAAVLKDGSYKAKADRYGRKVGKVLLAGLDCNLVQVKRGLVWHYKQYQREQSPADQQSYAAAEIEARQVQAGLWRDAAPVLPW